MEVVLPTPLTPTTNITCGLLSPIDKKSSSSWESHIILVISSFRIVSNSSELINLSFFTLSSIWSIILSVVLTPTSELISTSSRLSKTSSSTLLLPTITLEILLKNESLLFLRPLSRVSFFSFVNSIYITTYKSLFYKIPELDEICTSWSNITMNSKYTDIIEILK